MPWAANSGRKGMVENGAVGGDCDIASLAEDVSLARHEREVVGVDGRHFHARNPDVDRPVITVDPAQCRFSLDRVGWHQDCHIGHGPHTGNVSMEWCVAPRAP
jgi:hypothetical protein